MAEDLLLRVKSLERRVQKLETLDSEIQEAAAGAGGAPVDAAYVVLAYNGNLTNERRLQGEAIVTVTDGGANNPVTVALGDYARGSLVVGGVAEWEDLVIGANQTYLRSDGVDAAWSAILVGDLPDHTHSGAGQGGSLVVGTTDTDATPGSVFFAGAGGVIQEDNTSFYYDNTNDRLGVGADAVAPATRTHFAIGSAGADPAWVVANDITIFESSSNVNTQYFTPATNTGVIGFSNPGQRNNGVIQYNHATDDMSFTTATTLSVVINANQDVGIRRAAPTAQLDVNQDSNSANQPTLKVNQRQSAFTCIRYSSNAVDRDIILGEVEVTGTPQWFWDESEDAISYNVGHIFDDGSGNSPFIRFVGGSNNDEIELYLVDDAVAGDSDLAVVLADAAGDSHVIVYDSTPTAVLQIDSDGNIDLLVNGATIGLAGDPLLTFDYTNDDITLTGGDFHLASGGSDKVLIRSSGDVANTESDIRCNTQMGLAADTNAHIFIDANGAGLGTTYFSIQKDDENVAAATELMRVTEGGYMGIGATVPNSMLELMETYTIGMDYGERISAGLTLDPAYDDGGGGWTVTIHNYIDLNNVQLINTAAVTDGCVFRFDAAPGTHVALDAGTTKTTPGSVNKWVKINANGTVSYIPAYNSKTA